MESDVWLGDGEEGPGEALPKAWETADKAVGETPAIAADFTNHILTETGTENGFLHDVGLGWAAG